MTWCCTVHQRYVYAASDIQHVAGCSLQRELYKLAIEQASGPVRTSFSTVSPTSAVYQVRYSLLLHVCLPGTIVLCARTRACWSAADARLGLHFQLPQHIDIPGIGQQGQQVDHSQTCGHVWGAI